MVWAYKQSASQDKEIWDWMGDLLNLKRSHLVGPSCLFGYVCMLDARQSEQGGGI